MDNKSLKIILKKINIPYYDDVYMKYINTECIIEFKEKYIEQYNEGILNKYIYNFENNDFIVYHHKYKNNHDISISKIENEKFGKCLTNNRIYKENIVYLHIIINNDKNAYLKFISYLKNNIVIDLICYNILSNMEDNDILIRLAIYFLSEKKHELNINKLFLYNDSYFYCPYKNKYLELSLLYPLVYGYTFFEKYGFKPEKDYDTKKYNMNLIKKTKVKNTTLFKYLFKFYCNNDNIKWTEIYNEFSELFIDDFFKLFIEKYDNNCYIISKFYNNFSDDINLCDYTNSQFYLYI